MEDNQRWFVFQIYNIYRVCLIGILFLYQYNSLPFFFYTTLSIYTITIAIFIHTAKHPTEGIYERCILISSLVDLLFLNSLLLETGSISKGVGILLNVSLASVAILLPGIHALFCAAFESILLLSYAYYLTNFSTAPLMFYAGIHGVGFFATALTSVMLAAWINKNRSVAIQRRKELESLQLLNGRIIEKIDSAIIFVNQEDIVFFANQKARQLFDLKNNPLPFPISLLPDVLQEHHANISRQNINQTIMTILKNDFKVTYLTYEIFEKKTSVYLIEDPKVLMQQANQLKLASLGRFTASIAHELRNPLGAISHASQLLAEQISSDNSEYRLNQIIEKNCNRMNDLIKNVLQLSRQEKSKMQRLDLLKCITDFTSDYPSYKKVNFIISVPSDSIIVLFDRSQIYQLFTILADNAAKYGRDAKDDCNFTFESDFDDSKNLNECKLRIYDDGQGIAGEQLEQVFEPFFTTSRSGVGLGLFIAKELCIANQAKIKMVDIGKQCGACFEVCFSLPCAVTS